MDRRLGRLETIWPPPEQAKPGLSPDERERMYLSTPALFWEIEDVAENRGRRRFLVPGQPAAVAWRAWGALAETVRRARLVRERELLDAQVRDLGRAMGLETWVREAVAIGMMFDGETDDYCWRMFQHSYGGMRASLDRSRAEHPTWGAETGWHPDMTDAAFLDFEWELLERLPELWAGAAR